MSNPINISPEHITGNCYYKCDYKFDYSGYTTFNMTKYGDNLGIVPTAQPASPPVKFNNNDYQLIEIMLQVSSYFLFSSYVPDATLLLSHICNLTGKRLFVIIPIVAQPNASSGDMLDQMVQNLSAMGTNTSSFSLVNTTINRDIPRDPYYSFQLGYLDCIAFGRPSALTISQTNLNVLASSNIGATSLMNVDTMPPLYFNQSGPSLLGVTDNEIYIDCQPTNASEETVPINPVKKDAFKAPEIQQFIFYLILMIVVVAIFFVFFYLFTWLGKSGASGKPVGAVVTAATAATTATAAFLSSQINQVPNTNNQGPNTIKQGPNTIADATDNMNDIMLALTLSQPPLHLS